MKNLELDKIVKWKVQLASGKKEIEGVDRTDIERQWLTTKEILNRFSSPSYPAVLLGDEVGMGKTFVALASMATFAAASPNAKILLIVPKSDVLKKKWLQDMDTFQARYIVDQGKKILRPAEVDNVLELLMAANPYANIDLEVIRNDNDLKYAFLHELTAWYKTKSKNIRRGVWKTWIENQSMQDTESWEFAKAYQTMSALALRSFFESDPNIGKLVADLEKGSFGSAAAVNNKLKEFLSVQANHLPNIFIIRMGHLGFPKGGSEDRKTFGTALLERLCSGRESSTFEEVVKTLSGSNLIWNKSSFDNSRWSSYVQSIKTLPEAWGLKPFLASADGQRHLKEHTYQMGKRSPILTWKEIYSGLYNGTHFKEAEGYIDSIGRKIVKDLIEKIGFSLSVIDEVHNWKSGFSNGAVDYKEMFAGTIEKTLLMSATPFQIDPQEFCTIFSTAVRVENKTLTAQALSSLYDKTDGLVVKCIGSSAEFHKCWAVLSTEDLDKIRKRLIDRDTGNALEVIRREPGHSLGIYDFLKSVEQYKSALKGLAKSLRILMIRHTKERVRQATGKRPNRHFHSGTDYRKNYLNEEMVQVARLPSTHGYTADDQELALFEFVAMRFDQLLGDHAKMSNRGQEKRKSQAAHLMAGLTSSLSAFAESQENKRGQFEIPPHLDRYRKCLNEAAMSNGLIHPKVEATCSRLFSNWEHGRKSLVFCYRVATVTEIVDSVSRRIKERLSELSLNFPFLQGDLQPLLGRSFLYREDRVWFSLIASQLEKGIHFKDSPFYKQTTDYLVSDEFTKAIKSAMAGIEAGTRDRERTLMWWLDAHCLLRFLVLRPMEGVNAPEWLLRQLKSFSSAEELVGILDKSSSNRRENPYVEDAGEEANQFETRKSKKMNFRDEVNAVAFSKRYIEGASVWFAEKGDVQLLHKSLWDLWNDEAEFAKSGDASGNIDVELAFWLRGQMVRAIRNVLLRPDVVVRLLTAPNVVESLNKKKKLQDHFGILSEQTFTHALGGQTMVRRVIDYLIELKNASGSLNLNLTKESRRRALFEGALLVIHKEKAPEIRGLTGKNRETRSQVCQAFNSPLMPDALVCTSIGQEGIDLHLYCADVIHHDLPWNPAVLEQRTGRVDRVRSLSERESAERERAWIQIGVPFMGNNYDQYQYDVLVQRAQKFDILMGDESVKKDWERAENESYDEGGLDISIVEGESKELTDSESSRVLPEELIRYLTLDLSIWKGNEPLPEK